MNINQLMKQAQQMQKKMEEAQKKVEELEVEGPAGGGMVKVIMNGKGIAKSISIDKTIIDPEDNEMLEDLVVAAINDAKSKIDEESGDILGEASGGLKMPPGMKMPF